MPDYPTSDIPTVPEGPVDGGYRVKALSQSAIKDMLGFGSRTIGQGGCLLTSFAMAANAITGVVTPWTPQTANLALKKGGAFPIGSSSMRVIAGAQALGMKLLERVSVLSDEDHDLAPEVRHHLLFDHGIVVVGVDYKPGQSSAVSLADHFCLIARVNAQGSFAGVDPAGGHPFVLNANLTRDDRNWRITEALFLIAKP